MNARQEYILARRRVLTDRIIRQRYSLGQEVELWVSPLALVDQGWRVLRFVRRHPVLVTGGLSLLLTLRRGQSAGAWFGRGLIAWRLINKFGGLR